MATFEMDANRSQYVEFYAEAKLDKIKTQAAGGKPVYEDKDYIRIISPGARDSEFCRPVQPKDIQAYPEKWEAYKSNEVQVEEGLPLDKWAYLTQAQVKTIKARNVHTVEQLANLTDSASKTLGLNGTEIRRAAQEYLSSADDKMDEINRLKADKNKQDVQIKELTDQVGELQSSLKQALAAIGKQGNKEQDKDESSNDSAKRKR